MSGDSQERKCTPKSVEGVWFNELGSKMDLKVDDDGIITGKYHSAVQADEPTGLTAKIIGGMSPDGSHDTFGFSVVWNTTGSTTSWAGEYKTCCGEQVLYTTWILTDQTESCNETWKSTLIGKDVFTRYKQRQGPPPIDGKLTRCHALGLLNKSD